MASISPTSSLDRAVKAVTFATRTAVAVGIPTYIFSQLDSLPTLKSPPAKLIAASVVILSTPSTLYCALGALEGFVRSCGHYFNYLTKENGNFHWDKFSKEMTTLHGLVRGALSPLSGYVIMHREWNKLGLNRDKDSPRVLKEEYVVYSVPRTAGQAVVEAAKWALRQLKVGFDFAVEKGIHLLNRLWAGVCWAANTTISIIQWGWRVSEPLRTLVWNITVTVTNWSIDRIVDIWNITRPIRTLAKLIVWDFTIRTLIWNFLIRTMIADWIVTKFIWNFLIEIVLCKVIWIPVKFIFKNIIWPLVKWTGIIIGTVISYAFSVIAWATQQAFRRGK